MVSFKEYFPKERKKLLIPILISISVGIILTVIFAFVRNYIIFGFAIGVPVLTITITLLFFKYKYKGNKEEQIDKSIRSVTHQMEQILKDDYLNVMEPAPVVEIKNLERKVVAVMDTLRNRTYTEDDFDFETLPTNYFEEGILDFDSFRTQVVARCTKRFNYSSCIVALKISGRVDSETRSKLATLVKESFEESIVGIEEEDVLLAYFDGRGTHSITFQNIKTLVSKFNVADFDGEEANVTTVKAGIAYYPYSSSTNVITHAIEALASDDDVSQYKYEDNLYEDENDFSLSRRYARSMYTLQKIGNVKNDEISGQDLREKIDKVIEEYAKLFGFDNGGYSLKVSGKQSLKTVSEYKKTDNDTGFVTYGEMKYERLKDYFKLFDNNGIFYGSDIDGLPLSCRAIFENLEIKSFYHFKVYFEGQLIGFVYFNDYETKRVFDSTDLELLVNIKNCLSDLISTFIAWNEKDEMKQILESVMKIDEKYVYGINKDSYEIIYNSTNLEKFYPDIAVGKKCYEVFNPEKTPCKDCPLKNGHSNVKRERLGKDLRATVILSTSGSTTKKFVMIQNSLKANKRVEEQLDLQFRIPTGVALYDDVGFDLKNDASGYIALIKCANTADIAPLLPTDGSTRIMGEMINRIQAMGYGDWIYRYSDDVLALLFHRYPRTEALDAIEKIFARLTKNFEIEGVDLRPDYSAALASFPGDIVTMKDFKSTLNTAITTMNELGHNILYIFGEKGGRKLDRSSYILDVLDEAVKKNKLQVFIQPVINAATNQPVEGEALLRLIDPTRGFIPPLEFVPIASKNGRMFEIEQSIIVSIGELWKKHGFGIFKQVGVKRISVNISSDSLNNPDFASRVEKTVKKYKFPNNFLQLEIAESLVYQYTETLSKVMTALAPVGVAFAIDNFGTVATTKGPDITLPFNEVKIDRSCILDIEQSKRSIVSLSYMIEKAKENGYEVVAQGIEHDTQIDLLKDMKIDDYQGYYFSKPLSINNYIEFLNFKN